MSLEHIDHSEDAFRAVMRVSREVKRWSQSDLADRMQALGFDSWRQSTVAKVEAGERPLRLAEALAIAGLFETTIPQMVTPDQRLRDSFAETLNRTAEVVAARHRHAAALAELREAERMLTEKEAAYAEAEERYNEIIKEK